MSVKLPTTGRAVDHMQPSPISSQTAARRLDGVSWFGCLISIELAAPVSLIPQQLAAICPAEWLILGWLRSRSILVLMAVREHTVLSGCPVCKELIEGGELRMSARTGLMLKQTFL